MASGRVSAIHSRTRGQLAELGTELRDNGMSAPGKYIRASWDAAMFMERVWTSPREAPGGFHTERR